MKILLGILTGVCLVLILFYGFRKIVNPYYAVSIPQFITDTSKKRLAQEDLIGLKTATLSLEEKISSANKRIDDILIFGGIIVTLLLAINVVVYVNAERQVEKYFRDNFEAHKQKVLTYRDEIEEMVGQAKTELELAQTLRRQAQTIQTPE
jgi:hypothetical protein